MTTKEGDVKRKTSKVTNFCRSLIIGEMPYLFFCDFFSMVKILIMGSRNVYPIFIPFFGCQVSGVSVQDMHLRLPFLTPET